MTIKTVGTVPWTAALRRQALAGMTWLGFGQAGAHLIAIATSLVLARLLAPAQFGLAAMATVATGIVSTVANLGLPTAIVQRELVMEVHRSSAFWLLLGWGLLLWSTMAVVATPVAAFFQTPEVAGLMTLYAFTLFLAAGKAVPNGLLVRAMDFRRLVLIDLAASLTAAGTSVALAFSGWGSWSLIWGSVASGVVSAAGSWAYSGWRPRGWLRLEALRELLPYGLDLTGFSIVNYLGHNIDYILVGRILGAGPLGVYTKAYEMMTLPQTKLVPIVTRALFPAFSRMQDDQSRLRRAYLRLSSAVALISVPMLLGLALTSPELVPLLLGRQWTGVVLPTQILCAAGILYANGTTTGTILFTQGHTRLALRIAVCGLVGITACVAAGSRFGVTGVAFGIVGYATVAIPIIQHLTNRVIALPMRDLLMALRPAAVSGTVMAVAVVIGRWLTADLGSVTRLALLVGTGVIVYIGTLRTGFPLIFAEVRGLLRELLRPIPGETP